MSQNDRHGDDAAPELRVALRMTHALSRELKDRLRRLKRFVVVDEAQTDEVDVLISEWPGVPRTARNHHVLWVVAYEESSAPPAGQSFVHDAAPDDQWKAAIEAVAAGLTVRPDARASAETDESDGANLEPLTVREREVLDLLALGLPNRAIARRLRISEHTVKFHLAAIFGKLQVATRTEATRRALQQGLITI